MAGKIPAGDFNTRISLNGAQPIETLKTLRSEVTSTTSAWKAQVFQMKETGNLLGAAEAKFKGLSEAVQKQKAVLEKQTQALNELKKAQKEVDTSTELGKRKYEHLGQEIARAEKKVQSASGKFASISKQQDKALNSLNYYKSGLAKAQKELKGMTASSNAYIGRLEAEGKKSEATKVRLESLTAQQKKLTEIYKIQNNELTKIANTAGKSSEAYRRQKIRVDETATSLAKTKTEMKGLSSEMGKTNTSVFDRIKAKLKGVNGEATKTHKTLKDVFMGSFIGNVASNALGNITSGLKSTIASGMQLDATVAKIRAQWAGLGKNKNDTQILVDQMSYLKSNTAMAGGEVHQLQLNMNRLTNGNLSHTLALSKSIATIGDSTKMTSQQMVGLSNAMARALSGSKVSAMQWNRMTKQAPGLGAALSKAAGMSEEAFGKMVASGKMSTKKFEELVEKAGQDGGKAFENFKKTQGGAAKSMADSWAGLKAKMAQPLFDAKTSGMQQLASLMQSGPVQEGAEMLGKAIQKLASFAMKGLGYIAKHKKDIVDIGKDFVGLAKDIAVDVWKDFSSIITDIGSAFGLTSKNAKDAKDPLKMLRDAIHGLAKNKQAIQLIAKAIVAIAAVKTLKPVAGSLLSIASGSYKAYKNVKALHAGFKGLESIKELEGPEAALAKLGSKASTVFGKIKSLASDALSGNSFKGTFQSLKSAGGFKGLSNYGRVATGAAGIGVAIDSGSQFVNAYKDRHNADKRSTDIGKGIGSAIGGGIGMYFGGPAGAAIGSQIGKAAGAWGGQAVNKFTKGWQSHKPPKKFWSLENLGWSTKDAFGKMGKGIGNWWKSVQKSNEKAQKENEKQAAKERKLQKKRQKAWNDYWAKFGKNTKKGLSNAKKGIDKWGKDTKKNFDKAGKNTSKFFKELGPNAKKSYEKFLKNGHNFWKKFNTNFGKSIKDLNKNKYVKAFKKGKLFQTAYKDILKNTKKWSKKFGKSWQKHWKDTRKTVDKWSKNTKKGYKKGIKYLEKSFKSYTKRAKKSWNKHWNGLKKSVGKFWDSAKKKSAKGTDKLLKGVKNYAKESGKEWKSHYKWAFDVFDDYQKNLKKNHGNLFDSLKDTMNDQLENIRKGWQNKWNDISKFTSNTWDNMKKGASNWGKNLNSWFDNFGKNWKSGWHKLSSGVSKIFDNLWKSMKKLASSGINGLIDIVNGGISAVDDVIYFFGGSRSTVKKVGHVKFASGTGYFGSQRRAITKPTLAMVNDGNDSPETGNKEALYRPQTGEFGIFQGRNQSTVLMPGDEIFNATETKMLMQGLGMEHFANGTGFFSNVGNFFGGIGNWAKDKVDDLQKFFNKAKEIIGHPIKYLDSIFRWTGVKGISRGAIHTMITKGFNKGKSQVNQFWSTLWSMVSGQLDGGAEGGLLGAVEKYGKGKPYVWGAAGPDSFDCSGLVMYALKHAFGKSFPHYSGDQYAMSTPVKDPQPGDLVFFGPGGRNHVGVYAGNGKYWSAMSPSSSPNIGMSPVSTGPGEVSYRRVPGLKGEGATSGPKANSGLEKFIKKMPGLGGFWKFIGKLSSMFGIAADAKDPAGTGADRWGEDIKAAAAAMHTSVSSLEVRKIISMIAGESGGNPKAVQPGADPDGDGSGPAKGLMQFKSGTFKTFQAPGHHNIFHGWDQLLALFNDSNWRNDIHFGAGWSPTGHRRYANGGIANRPSIFGEAGPEMAIPLSAVKSSRSYELLGKTAAIVAARDGINPENSEMNSMLMKKVDSLLTSIELLVQMLGDEVEVKTTMNMDGRKVGQITEQYVSKAMAHRMHGRKVRFSGR